MEDFPSNARRPPKAEEPKNIERVTSAEAVRRKRGLGRKFKDVFISGDARNTRDYVFFDVIVPAARDMFYDTFDAAMQRMIYGDTHRHRRGSAPPGGGYSNPPRIDYGGASRNPTRAQSSAPRSLSRRARARHDFDDLVIPSRQEAEEVIDRMFDILSRYGSVSVAHLYELTGIQSSHVDMKWGWTELRGAKALRQRQGGFLLDLPEPEPFD